jgi:oxygen-independent coproporphyrinogen-3 oxidase
MKLGHVRDQYFADKFGVRILERFAVPVGILRDRGYLTTDADSLRLTRDGLLQVDRLLYEFFLPEHKLALTA